MFNITYSKDNIPRTTTKEEWKQIYRKIRLLARSVNNILDKDEMTNHMVDALMFGSSTMKVKRNGKTENIKFNFFNRERVCTAVFNTEVSGQNIEALTPIFLTPGPALDPPFLNDVPEMQEAMQVNGHDKMDLGMANALRKQKVKQVLDSFGIKHN